MGLWRILWFLIFLGESCGQEQRYVISAPEVFYVGASENITIQAYGYTETFNAIVSIKSYPDRRLNYSSDSVNLSPENKFQNSANLKMQPIQLSEGKNSTSYVYLEVVSKHFSALKKMPVINNNGSLFNHTDKFLYMAQYSDGAFKEITNSRGDVKTTLKDGVGKIAAKYKHLLVKKCCHDGARRYKHHETCEERAARISIGPRCVQAFMECCKVAKPTTPTTDTFKISLLGKPAEIPTEIMRKRRDIMTTLEEAVESQVAKYKHAAMKKCCYDGARRNDYETCEERATHIKRRPICVRAFSDCCATAKQIRDKIGYKPIHFHSLEFAQ